jgi:antirestriction protein
MNKTTQIHEERVAVGCLSCYNDGILSYKYLNADELEEAYNGKGLAQTVCKQPITIYHNPEEWEIQDYEGKIQRFNLGGWPDIENLIQMMRLVDEEPAKYVVAYEAAVDHYQNPTVDQVEDMADRMMCVGDVELKDYFMEQAYDCGDIKDGDMWESYINWKEYARQQMFNYTEYKYDGDTYLIDRNF